MLFVLLWGRGTLSQKSHLKYPTGISKMWPVSQKMQANPEKKELQSALIPLIIKPNTDLAHSDA